MAKLEDLQQVLERIDKKLTPKNDSEGDEQQPERSKLDALFTGIGDGFEKLFADLGSRFKPKAPEHQPKAPKKKEPKAPEPEPKSPFRAVASNLIRSTQIGRQITSLGQPLQPILNKDFGRLLAELVKPLGESTKKLSQTVTGEVQRVQRAKGTPKIGAIRDTARQLLTLPVRTREDEEKDRDERTQGRSVVQQIGDTTRRLHGAGKQVIQGAGKMLRSAEPAEGGAAARGVGEAITEAAGEAGAVEGIAGGEAAGVGVAALASNPIGWAAGAALAVAGVVVSVVGLGKALQGLGESALESQRKLAEVSRGMAQVFAEKQKRDMMRDREIGDATADSAKELADAVGDLKDTFAPLDTGIRNIINKVEAWGIRFITPVEKAIVEAAKALGIAADDLKKPKEPTFAEFLLGVKKGGLTPRPNWAPPQ